MPVEIAVLQIANSLLVPIWKLTNTCFIALPHAKSIFLPTQHKSVTYITLPEYSKSSEAGVHTVCIWHSESDMEVSAMTSWENFQISSNNIFCSSPYLHSLVCAVLLMFASIIHLPFQILIQKNHLFICLSSRGAWFT